MMVPEKLHVQCNGAECPLRDGKFHDELHVDGGVTRQLFLFPPGYDPKIIDAAIEWKPRRRAYIICNGKIDAQFEAVEAALLPITSRSISTLIKTQGIGDLYRIYLVSRVYNIDYKVVYTPMEFQSVTKTMFDPVYMTALFELGYQQGSTGYRWQGTPGLWALASAKVTCAGTSIWYIPRRNVESSRLMNKSRFAACFPRAMRRNP
jgi:hypothetical protein